MVNGFSMQTLCENCAGGEPWYEDAVCIGCGRSDSFLHADPGDPMIQGYVVNVTVEEDYESEPMDTVLARSSHQPLSSAKDELSFQARFESALEPDAADVARILSVLLLAVRSTDRLADLDSASPPVSARTVLIVHGRRERTRVVNVPIRDVPQTDGSADSQTLSRASDNPMALVREVLIRRRPRANDALLILNAAALGTAVNDALVQSYNAAYGDPATEFGLLGVWILGHMIGSIYRLG
jgi:hypothetical protein